MNHQSTENKEGDTGPCGMPPRQSPCSWPKAAFLLSQESADGIFTPPKHEFREIWIEALK